MVPADRAERERIQTSLDETLVVEAAAGTGKTTQLVGRLINVLAEGRGKVDTVAAVTFTDKAAGELKLRLRAGLEAARREAPSGARRENLEDAIARLEEARIGTIHSFCADLLRERPVEARVDPAFVVLTETQAEDLYGRAFGTWMETALEDPPEGIRRALRRFPVRDFGPDPDDGPIGRIRRAGWDLVDRRHLRAPWRRLDVHRDERIGTLVDELHALAGQLAGPSRGNDGLFQDTWRGRRLSDDIRDAERSRPRDADGLEAALIDLAQDKKFCRPRTGVGDHYRAGVPRAEILAAHGRLIGGLEEFQRQADADLAALLHAELLAVVDRYESLKARQGALDFTDLLIQTRDLLRDRPDVRAVMQRRLSHIFVDEFQDTDPVQAEIIVLLAAADPAFADWRAAVPLPGKLFLVGDPKQSIYRFRGADVGMYQEVKTLLRSRGATVLQLTTSFRAVPSIQRLVNRAFGGVIHEDPKTLQAAYVPLTPHRDDRAQCSVVALPVPSPYGRWGDVTKTAIRESVPGAVAAFVDWLLAESGWTVTERDNPDPVPIESRHVCLLLRQFSAWGTDLTQAYVDALEARGIPHLLVGGKSFHVREEVECLRNALAAIEWPDDELSLFATLKGPLFAVGDEELLEWRHRFGRLNPYRRLPESAPVPDHLTPIARALAFIRELHRRRNARPIDETIHELLVATRAHAGFVLRPRGEQVLANVMRVGDLARGYEAAGGLSFRGFVDRLRDEATTEAPEAPILEEGSEGVRIMTVHKAKGLEFPVVVLADPTANLAATRASRYVDTASGLCALRLAGWSPQDLLDHEAEEVDRDRAEGLRVAYVAATRARDLLVVPVLGDDPFEGAWQYAEDGWVGPVQRAVYPPAPRRHSPGDPPAGLAFGPDSVRNRPAEQSPGPRTVRPGLHVLGDAPSEEYGVLWWDPHLLNLDAAPIHGVRRHDLILDAGADVVAAGRRLYDEWRAERDGMRERGRRAAITLETAAATGASAAPHLEEAAAAVRLVDARSDVPKPGGPRFGTLLHAMLATVRLDASADEIAAAAETQGRILAAPAAEVESARRIVEGLLPHPLLKRAEAASRQGMCRREVPVAWVDGRGVLIEGVLDLAFEDEDGWTILDFKTDGEINAAEPHYRRQVALYAAAVAKATAKNTAGVLLRI